MGLHRMNLCHPSPSPKPTSSCHHTRVTDSTDELGRSQQFHAEHSAVLHLFLLWEMSPCLQAWLWSFHAPCSDSSALWKSVTILSWTLKDVLVNLRNSCVCLNELKRLPIHRQWAHTYKGIDITIFFTNQATIFCLSNNNFKPVIARWVRSISFTEYLQQGLNMSYFFFLSLFILRERDCIRGRGRERERIPRRLWAVSTELDEGLKPIDLKIMTWARVGCLTDWATQAPLILG